jgi:DNA-binding MarR family transcriptional regulator
MMTCQLLFRYAVGMPRWLTDEEQRAWRAYRRIVLLVDSAVARDLTRDSGLSMPDYLVLSALSEAADHRRRLTDLASRMQWSASRLSHHVTRMEQRGLVERAGCASDLRGAYIVLTEAGWDAIRSAAPDHVESVRAHLIDLLSEDELATLVAIGGKIAAHFGEQCVAAADAEDRAALASS